MPTADFEPVVRERVIDRSFRERAREQRRALEAPRERRSFTLLDAADALRQGKIPNNQQLDHALAYLADAPGMASISPDLSPEGRRLWADSRKAIRTLRAIIATKNQGEVLQSMVYHSRLATENRLAGAGGVGAVAAETTRPGAKASAMDTLTLLRALISDSNLRNALGDLNTVFQEMLEGFDVPQELLSTYRTERETEIKAASPSAPWPREPQEAEHEQRLRSPLRRKEKMDQRAPEKEDRGRVEEDRRRENDQKYPQVQPQREEDQRRREDDQKRRQGQQRRDMQKRLDEQRRVEQVRRDEDRRRHDEEQRRMQRAAEDRRRHEQEMQAREEEEQRIQRSREEKRRREEDQKRRQEEEEQLMQRIREEKRHRDEERRRRDEEERRYDEELRRREEQRSRDEQKRAQQEQRVREEQQQIREELEKMERRGEEEMRGIQRSREDQRRREEEERRLVEEEKRCLDEQRRRDDERAQQEEQQIRKRVQEDQERRREEKQQSDQLRAEEDRRRREAQRIHEEHLSHEEQLKHRQEQERALEQERKTLPEKQQPQQIPRHEKGKEPEREEATEKQDIRRMPEFTTESDASAAAEALARLGELTSLSGDQTMSEMSVPKVESGPQQGSSQPYVMASAKEAPPMPQQQEVRRFQERDEPSGDNSGMGSDRPIMSTQRAVPIGLQQMDPNRFELAGDDERDPQPRAPPVDLDEREQEGIEGPLKQRLESETRRKDVQTRLGPKEKPANSWRWDNNEMDEDGEEYVPRDRDEREDEDVREDEYDGEEEAVSISPSEAPRVALSHERRLEITEKFMTAIGQIQENKSVKNSIVRLLDSLHQRVNAASQRRGLPEAEAGDANVRQAGKEFKRLLERFANNYSLDDLTAAVKRMRMMISTDARLREIVEGGISYIRRAMDDPSYRKSDECLYRGANLLRSARIHLHNVYREDMATIARESDDFVRAFRKDRLSQRLAAQLRRVSDDVYTTRNGETNIRPRLVRDMVAHIGPMMFRELSVIHVPQTNHSDRSLDITIDPFDIHTSTITPCTFNVKAGNELFVTTREGLDSDLRQEMTVRMLDILPHITNVPFSYRTKGGFSMSDKGRLDVHVIGEKGIDLLMGLDVYPENPFVTIVPRRVNIDMDRIRLVVHKSKRDRLYRTLSPVLSRLLRRQLVDTIQDHVVGTIEALDRQITAIKVQTAPGGMKMKDPRERLTHHIDMFLKSLGFASTADALEEAISAPEEEGYDIRRGSARRLARRNLRSEVENYGEEEEEVEEEYIEAEEGEDEDERELEDGKGTARDGHRSSRRSSRLADVATSTADNAPRTDYSTVPWASPAFDMFGSHTSGF